MGNLVGAFGALLHLRLPRAMSFCMRRKLSVKVGNWQVVADADGGGRQSHIQSGCGTGESRHTCCKPDELFRDDVHCTSKHALSLLDEKQGAQRLAIQ